MRGSPKIARQFQLISEEEDVETEETEENLTVRTNPDLQSDEEELEIPSTITSLYLPEQVKDFIKKENRD